MGKYFGTDGVRGVANQTLTPELAFKLGVAAATALSENCDQKVKILIGKDTRISGDMLEAALAAGMCSTGADVYLLGIIPTPGVAILCRRFKATAGAVISASHNPFEDNGIKFFSASGYKLPDVVEDEIERLMDDCNSLNRPVGEKVGRIHMVDAAAAFYVQILKEKFPLDLRGIKMVLDTANGAASFIGPELFTSLGTQVVAIADQPDGCNINKDCGSTHMQLLQKTVLQEKADIGIALDGDADRVLAVDEKGNLMDGDMILAICAVHMQKQGLLKNDTLVATIMSNMGLKVAMQKHGIQMEETKVGDRYVLEQMLASGAVLGGEQSGHIIFSEYNTTGDGLASALFLLEVMQQNKQSLSELNSVMQKLPQVLINVRVSTKESWQDDADIFTAYEEAQKQLASRGRALIRPSGTEPVLRVMVEGDNEEELQALANRIADVIREKRGK